mmetsp:Transcript_3672/g.7627  ORF Transcript_3672/g.7627 Transcript_3672/m.7627 type:complete len:84 (-) Transcript_3672:12-263(-)
MDSALLMRVLRTLADDIGSVSGAAVAAKVVFDIASCPCLQSCLVFLSTTEKAEIGRFVGTLRHGQGPEWWRLVSTSFQVTEPL